METIIYSHIQLWTLWSILQSALQALEKKTLLVVSSSILKSQKWTKWGIRINDGGKEAMATSVRQGYSSRKLRDHLNYKLEAETRNWKWLNLLMWIEEKTLLVVVQTCTATMEIHPKFSQKTENQSAPRPSNTTLGHLLKEALIFSQELLFN